MKIFVVDDSETARIAMAAHLEGMGYDDAVLLDSAEALMELLNADVAEEREPEADLIIMDIVMPGMDGIEATRLIKANKATRDIPVVAVTVQGELESLERAFDAGAIDFMSKPVHRIEVRARLRSALKLREEMKKRRERERELETLTSCLQDANEKFRRESRTDELTGARTRERFDEVLDREWRRARRRSSSLALAMADVDGLEAVNRAEGRLKGDKALRLVAQSLRETAKRAGDLVARYDGDTFAILLADADEAEAELVAGELGSRVREAGFPGADGGPSLTVSLGVAVAVPAPGLAPVDLVNAAQKALAEARTLGPDTSATTVVAAPRGGD